MKYSKYLWAIDKLNIEKGAYLTEDLIYEAYDEVLDKDDKVRQARDYLLDFMEEINEYNEYDEDEEEYDDEDYQRYQYKRRKKNTLIIIFVFFILGVGGFIFLQSTGILENDVKYLEYQLYGDTYMVSLNSEFEGENIEIPEMYNDIKITRIGNFNSYTLKNIIIHANIEVINDNAFNGCTGLEKITIPSSVKVIGSGAFANCISLKEVSINGNITEVAANTFVNCIELISVYLPNSVRVIGKNAFEGCIKMKNFSMPNNIVEIHDYAFLNCKEIRNISFGNKLYSIGKQAFRNCKSLNGILIPESINYLGDFVFKGCENLLSFAIKDNNELTYVGENIIADTLLYDTFTIGYYASGGWIIFTKGYIGELELTKNVSKRAFYDTSLTISKLTIKDSVKYILEEAFVGILMEEISLPESIKLIGSKAFYGNSRLKSIKIGFKDPAYIQNYSIRNCFGFDNEDGNTSLYSDLKIYVLSAYVNLFKDELQDSSTNFIKKCIFAY